MTTSLKDLMKHEMNKYCFICTERGVSYIDLDHYIFVCTPCAGLLREVQFKIKSPSQGIFTKEEISNLANGNEGATLIWMNTKREIDRPKPGDVEKCRKFIGDCFVKRLFLEDSIGEKVKKGEKSVGDSKSNARDGEKGKADKGGTSMKASTTTSFKGSPDSKKIDSNKNSKFDEEFDFGDDETTGKAKATMVVVTPAKAQVNKPTMQSKAISMNKPQATQSMDLLDMDFFGVATTSSPMPVTPVVQTPARQFVAPTPARAPILIDAQMFASPEQRLDEDDFADFVSATPVVAAAAATKPTEDPFDFGDFALAMPAVPVVSNAPPSPENPFTAARLANRPNPQRPVNMYDDPFAHFT